MRSRSKKSEPGIWLARKEERPVRCWGSLGRNHAALSGSIRDWGSDSVEADVVHVPSPRASWSSLGDTRVEEKVWIGCGIVKAPSFLVIFESRHFTHDKREKADSCIGAMTSATRKYNARSIIYGIHCYCESR